MERLDKIKEVKKVRSQNQTLQQRNQNIQNQHNRRRIRLYKGHERQTRHTHCRMRLLVEQKQVSNEFHCKQTYFVQNFFNPRSSCCCFIIFLHRTTFTLSTTMSCCVSGTFWNSRILRWHQVTKWVVLDLPAWCPTKRARFLFSPPAGQVPVFLTGENLIFV